PDAGFGAGEGPCEDRPHRRRGSHLSQALLRGEPTGDGLPAHVLGLGEEGAGGGASGSPARRAGAAVRSVRARRGGNGVEGPLPVLQAGDARLYEGTHLTRPVGGAPGLDAARAAPAPGAVEAAGWRGGGRWEGSSLIPV